MKLIPALDLKNSCVVRAIGGDRESYRPLVNARFSSPSPVDVVKQLHRRFQLRTFYIADLDAIAGTRNNAASIRKLTDAFPEFKIWLDAGIRNYADFKHLRDTHPVATPIVATETLTDPQLLASLHSAREDFILSLDIGAEGLLGDAAVLKDAENWPEIVIVLSLHSVGTDAGPDLETIRMLQEKYPRQRFVAAGGIRDERDLARLESRGIATTLVASALYNGAISE